MKTGLSVWKFSWETQRWTGPLAEFGKKKEKVRQIAWEEDVKEIEQKQEEYLENKGALVAPLPN